MGQYEYQQERVVESLTALMAKNSFKTFDTRTIVPVVFVFYLFTRQNLLLCTRICMSVYTLSAVYEILYDFYKKMPEFIRLEYLCCGDGGGFGVSVF